MHTYIIMHICMCMHYHITYHNVRRIMERHNLSQRQHLKMFVHTIYCISSYSNYMLCACRQLSLLALVHCYRAAMPAPKYLKYCCRRRLRCWLHLRLPSRRYVRAEVPTRIGPADCNHCNCDRNLVQPMYLNRSTTTGCTFVYIYIYIYILFVLV